MILEGSERQNNKNSAVSETVGYIIIFGIMMTGIALIILLGYPALLNQQQEANIRNMERNMIVLQSDVNALVYKSVPYKETTMQVNGGVFSVKRPDQTPSFFTISDDSGSLLDTTLYPNGQFKPGELQFLSESNDISVSLENGAVVKYQTGGSVMLSEPRWFIDSSTGTTTMVISLIQVDSSKILSKSGICTVQLSIEPLPLNSAGDNIVDKSPVGGNVIISTTLSARYYKAWANYYTSTLGMEEITGTTWRKTGVDRVVIKAWRINVINL